MGGAKKHLKKADIVKKLLLTFTLVFIVFHFFAFIRISSAEVIIYDAIILSGKSVKLKAVTKSRFFTEGGIIVEFFANGKKIGRTLSGGDGYAFLAYRPSSSGIETIKVTAGDDTDEGTILAAGKKDKVIIVSIENALISVPFSFEPAPGGSEALQKLGLRYRIIYLSGFMDVKRSRQWVRDKGFPISPVLKWEGKSMLAELREQGIKVIAFIGSPEMLSEAQDIKIRLSFEETDDGTVVKDWKDVNNLISDKDK